MAGNSSNSSTTSTGSAAGAAGAGVGAGVGSTSTGSQTSSTSGKGSSGTSTSGKGGSTGSGLTFTGLTFSDGKFSAPSGKGTAGSSTSTKGVTLGSVGTGLGLDGSIGEGIGLTTQSNTSSSKAEPVMTVDEVYGKGNQSIVENQGDYEAASNEKSNVETQTFGKQDEISFTPESITENKGEVENDTIQSIEGLDFQQKDKANQEVMDAKKARDDAEAEDKSDKAREQLAANEAEENEELTFNFKVGEKNDFEEQNKARLNELNNQKKELDETNKALEETKNAKLEADKQAEQAENNYQEVLSKKDQADALIQDLISQLDRLNDNALTNFITKVGLGDIGSFDVYKSNVTKMAEAYNIEIGDISKASVSELKAVGKKVANEVKATFEQDLKTAKNELANAQKQQKDLETRQYTLMSKSKELESKYTQKQEAYKTWEAGYWANAEKSKAEEAAAANAKSNAEVSFEATKEAINNADLTEETKSKAIESINNVEAVTKSVNDAADALAANPNDPATIEAYVNAVKTYNENVENALKGNPLAKTDFNKTFTEMVAKANDFDVTMPDGTKVSYAEFAAEKAVESPALAKGLYEAKAKTLADEGHTVLAAIENAKAKMVTTWLGSKFTFADNQVRSQFNQMAKTDMRATYATYNNVLSDPNATPEQRADAEAQIAQAKSLMTASAALQASTGFLSGIGDSMKDGVYGVTDPNALTVSQKTMNTISNFAKAVLGLGVTPGANEAYQNMYYLAGDKAKNSMLFGKDFDGDGFALCQEYGNNAAAGMIAGVGELATGIALFFNPATAGMGLNLAMDSVQTFLDGLYGVQREAQKSVKYSSEIVSYLREAKDIVSDAGTEKEKTVSTAGVTIDRVIDSAISQIENFELKSDEANNLDNWLEGSGSNTATNEKFNQSLTYDEWLKLIEADPTMQEYAKKLIAEKK